MTRESFSVKENVMSCLRTVFLVFALVGVVLFLGSVDNAAALFPAIEDPIPSVIPFGDVSIEFQTVASGFASPVAHAVAPGHPDTLFIGDQTGQIWAVDLSGKVARQLFADLSGRLIQLGIGSTYYDERGLLGLVFHPDFLENGLFFTYTSEPVTQTADFSTMPLGVAPNCQNVLAMWRVEDPSAESLVFDSSFRREVFRIDKPQEGHNGGYLAFDQNKLLFISLGDGGNPDDLNVGHAPGGNAQNLDPGNVLGKILRIDPLGQNSPNSRYGIPSDNPLIGKKGQPEIYAYGFRNPWRMSFDFQSGLLYVGDVGQNDIEEIDIIVPGGNYGWPIKEGTFLFANRDNCAPPRGPTEGCVYQNSPGVPSGLIDPIAEYDHIHGGVAIIGGFVYHGNNLKGLQGRYVFGDYAGRLFYLDSSNQIKELMIPSRIGPDGKTALGFSVLGFGQDAQGELYLLANRSGTLADPCFQSFPGTSGEVLGLVPAGISNTTNPQQYTLTVVKAGTGSGTVTSSPAGINCGSVCSNAYNQGTVVTLTATPDSGSTFGGWSGACSGTGQCSLTMNADQTVASTFNPQQQQTLNALAVSVNPLSSGSVTKNPDKLTYVSGEQVILTATPAPGYTFHNWSGDVSNTSNPIALTIDSNKTVVANFTLISVTPSAHNFGNVKVKKSGTASFVVMNNGKANLSITSTITGTDASMFRITSGGGDKAINPGKSLTLNVAFKPTSIGSKSANLEITSNDPIAPNIDVPLIGTGQ